MKRKIILAAFLILNFQFLILDSLQAQLPVTWEPYFSTDNDSITIYYHADQGNAALTGVTPIYAHTGVITNLSVSPSDWKHVKTNWGVNDPATLLTPLGGNLFKIKFHVRNYYGVPVSETILSLAFVFRNSAGTVVGRNIDGSDIFIPIYDAGLNVKIKNPDNLAGNALVVSNGGTVSFKGLSSQLCNLSLYLNNNLVTTLTNADSLSYTLTASQTGINWIHFYGTDGITTKVDSFSFIVNPTLNIATLPPNTKDGVTYINDSTVILNLYAPSKNFVYVLGGFNNWQINTNYYMNRDPDGKHYWLQVTGLIPLQEYTYQYYVDASIKIADPYADKIVDPNNDFSIDNLTYPNKTPYPTNLTTGIVSVLQTAQVPYVWNSTSFVRPPKEKLVIYELLTRDFVAKHNYQTLIDTINYLQSLGITAIELMPPSEFEGNLSWGYNPNFFFAPDKYYGTKNKFKEFIDVCHGHGIAVIMDVVLNHCMGSCPFAQLYWNSALNQPAANNPWLNQTATHDFNVGNDFNHDSPDTRYFVDRFTEYWLQNYNIDGYRFDLAKGFTQTYSVGNIGLWGQYDASRVYNLTRMCGHIDSTSAGAYKILEMFADNSEETVYANQGIMLWGNSNYNYNEASMGWVNTSNFNWASYQQRGWNQPSLVSYMESHDEERLMYKNIMYGNSAGAPSYDIKDTVTGLARVELAATFFIPIPGPKMIWQFGELGYDYSINYCQNGTINTACRVDPKPIKWNYYTQFARRKLHNVYAALNMLKTTYPAFQTTNYQIQFSGQFKSMHLNHASMNVAILGNFGTTSGTIDPNFQSTGWWYEYFGGDSIYVNNVNDPVTLDHGAYKLYTNVHIAPFVLNVGINEYPGEVLSYFNTYPNPAINATAIAYDLTHQSDVQLCIYNTLGEKIKTLVAEKQASGHHEVNWDLKNESGTDVYNGIYFCKMTAGNKNYASKIIVQQ
ncbi:MAG: alpha-amylase family glycosyl hydrolase [Bacteroidia bacterium]